MKTLKLYLGSIIDNNDAYFESILDDDTFFDPKNNKAVVEEWIRDNYEITGKLTISDDLVVDCTGDAEVKNKSITSLTNGMFKWGVIKGDFYCGYCENLTSLEGAPEKVGERFGCRNCDNLKSLEGAPKEVRSGFLCSHCNKLTSLKGAPEFTRYYFDCSHCKSLTTLEGAPKKVDGNFFCSDCEKLMSLKGAPEKVIGHFCCDYCNSLTTLEGAPKKVDGSFLCDYCDRLESLEGAPKARKGLFARQEIYCRHCKNLKITDSDRKKYKIRK